MHVSRKHSIYQLDQQINQSINQSIDTNTSQAGKAYSKPKGISSTSTRNSKPTFKHELRSAIILIHNPRSSLRGFLNCCVSCTVSGSVSSCPSTSSERCFCVRVFRERLYKTDVTKCSPRYSSRHHYVYLRAYYTVQSRCCFTGRLFVSQPMCLSVLK